MNSKQKEYYLLVCIGNISERKNQILVLRAYESINTDLRKKCRLLFIGGNEDELLNYAVERRIEGVLFTGSISKAKVHSYLEIADLCIMASLDEGFGLPIIEAYSHGVPAIIPRNVDAFYDMYDPNCCIVAEQYTVKDFANAIEKALNEEWSKDKIINKSHEFLESSCSKEYLINLKNVSMQKKCCINVAEIEKMFECSIT